MNGHVRKVYSQWEIVLELGEQMAQRCPACKNAAGRSKRYWADDGLISACPACGGPLEQFTGRRQISPPERYRTKKGADEALVQILAAGLAGVFVEPDRMTVAQYLTDHWLPNLSGNVRESTLVAYRGHMERYIVPVLGKVRLRKLSPVDVDRLYRQLRDTRAAPGGGRIPRTTRRRSPHARCRRRRAGTSTSR